MWLDGIIKAAHQPNMLSVQMKGQFLNQCHKFTQADNSDHILRKTICLAFFNYLSNKTRIKHKNAVHFAVFILLALYIHLKMKTDLSVCVPGQFPFLDRHHWGGNSGTAGETFKTHTESCYHWKVWQKINLWTITAPVQLCENICSPPLSLLLLSKCQFQTQCSFKNVITRFQTLLNDFSTVISRGINPFKFMSPKWNVTSDLHKRIHKLYRVCRIFIGAWRDKIHVLFFAFFKCSFKSVCQLGHQQGHT